MLPERIMDHRSERHVRREEVKRANSAPLPTSACGRGFRRSHEINTPQHYHHESVPRIALSLTFWTIGVDACTPSYSHYDNALTSWTTVKPIALAPWVPRVVPSRQQHLQAHRAWSPAEKAAAIDNNMETSQLVEQLAAGFEALQGEYQKLFGQHQSLERKLATAREQVRYHTVPSVEMSLIPCYDETFFSSRSRALGILAALTETLYFIVRLICTYIILFPQGSDIRERG